MLRKGGVVIEWAFFYFSLNDRGLIRRERGFKGNCHELHKHFSKFVSGNMPGFLATFHSRNLLFCLELSLSPPKACYMHTVLPYIDATLNQT